MSKANEETSGVTDSMKSLDAPMVERRASTAAERESWDKNRLRGKGYDMWVVAKGIEVFSG